ncbi:AP2 domain-containing protein [Babesia caballi]|uniref:AP2 domain-containing protein n=1 Tax=Babesia caballi TaxID=5871 RepID=A0AAV4LP63_BABCB|nr:AP2 domain-containing protein [Babesia caballi]
MLPGASSSRRIRLSTKKIARLQPVTHTALCVCGSSITQPRPCQNCGVDAFASRMSQPVAVIPSYVSPVGKASPRRRRRGSTRSIPENAVILPNVPEEDYFSQVPGVYYHFAKLEWRATCRDPFNCSKRSQRTFGVRKYGFYGAKMNAEAASHNWDRHRQLLSFLQNVTNGDHLPRPMHPSSPLMAGDGYTYHVVPYGYEAYVPANVEHHLQGSSPSQYYNNGNSGNLGNM